MQNCSRKFEAGREISRAGFTTFIIFVWKTTSMHFDLASYCYTNPPIPLWLNFQRNQTN